MLIHEISKPIEITMARMKLTVNILADFLQFNGQCDTTYSEQDSSGRAVGGSSSLVRRGKTAPSRASSFKGKLRDELLNREVFDTLLEATLIVERWRQICNTLRPTVRWATDPRHRGGDPALFAS
jgi:hypothetical protein